MRRPRRLKVFDQTAEMLAPYRGSTLVVAVSGGLDSVALLDILMQLRDELALRLEVAHVDHGLRRRSGRHAEFVRQLSQGYGLPYHQTVLDLPRTGNTEALAREARYGWLEQIRQQVGADFVVTAHQADDQVETLFLHLTRGSGLTGLTGMQPLSGTLLRPLLQVPRRTLTRYVRRRKLAYRLDPTNRSVRLARNRIRRQVVTSLQKINPQLVETVSQSMRILTDEYDVLRGLANDELKRLTDAKSATEWSLSHTKLKRLRPGLRHLVWRELLRSLTGSLEGYRLAHLENLDDLLKRQTGSVIHLPKNIVAKRNYDQVVIGYDVAAPPEPITGELLVPGSVAYGEVTLHAAAYDPKVSPTNQSVVVDATLVGTRLTVRPPKVGDRFKPVGMRGSKLVSNLLTDAKVPRDERRWMPIVTTVDGDIVWVAGLRADRRFIAPDPANAVTLSIAKA